MKNGVYLSVAPIPPSSIKLGKFSTSLNLFLIEILKGMIFGKDDHIAPLYRISLYRFDKNVIFGQSMTHNTEYIPHRYIFYLLNVYSYINRSIDVI